MSANRAYLDWNATTPLLSEAREAMLVAMELVGNPSSIHAEGRAARALIEAARADVAALVNGEAENVVFTSGATEAINALAKAGICAECAGNEKSGAIHALAVEHAAVFAAAPEANVLAVDQQGVLIVDRLEGISPGALVFIQLANNETGVIQPIERIASVVHAAGAFLIVDAVQAPGRMPIDIKAIGADALVLSAHKFGGPKGVGAIVFSNRFARLATAHIAGGGQERGQRGGTENVIGMAGMGAAARVAKVGASMATGLSACRNEFEARLKKAIPDLVVFGEGAERLPNTSLIAIPGIAADRALVAADLAGVAISSGSACSSGKVKASHVLKAMGVEDALIGCAIRVSIGATTTIEDLMRCEEVLKRFAQQRKYAEKAA